jgi:hypothetical protein
VARRKHLAPDMCRPHSAQTPHPIADGPLLFIYRLSGVRSGEDLFSFRNSCSARSQNSSPLIRKNIQ